MKNKILIAVDESENSMKAAEYVADILGKDVEITLYHVSFRAPPGGIKKHEQLKGHHHVLFKEGIEEFSAWLEQRRAAVEEVIDKAKTTLIKAGIDKKNIKIKIQETTKGVARDILRELKAGEYDTVVVGRRGVSGTKAFFSGSVSSKIFHHAKNCAVWVVE